MQRIEIVIVGLSGRLGSTVARNLPENMEVVAGVVSTDFPSDSFDLSGRDVRLIHTDEAGSLLPGRVVVDCSAPAATEAVIGKAAAAGSPAVIATTGHSEAQLEKIAEAARSIPIVMESNFSVGMAVLRRIVKCAFPLPGLFELSIMERHNSSKKDSPSGTAKDLASRISDRYGGLNVKLIPGARKERDLEIVAVRAGRGGGSEHRILAEAPNEEIELRHTTTGSLAFVDGIVRSVEWVADHARQNGLYSLSDVLVD